MPPECLSDGQAPVRRSHHRSPWHTWWTQHADVDWAGTDMQGPGGGHKVNLVRDYLDTLPENDILLFTDAYDVFFTNNLQEIVKRYMDASVEILFGAEASCWPDESMQSLHPEPNLFHYKYLNSGQYIGRVGALKDFFGERLNDDDDDQLYMQRVWLNDTTKFSVGLDYEQYIFQTHEPEVDVGNELWNPITNTVPCLYHGNGGFEAKVKFDNLKKGWINRLKALSCKACVTCNYAL